jgi:hypothetical protein
MDTSYKAYREYLLELVDAIRRENGLEEENAVLILHNLSSVEKISRFVEWVKSRMDGEKLQATETEICRAAVQATNMDRSEEMYVERNKLLKTITRMDMPASTTLELIEPMKTMSEEEKEVFAKDLREKLERGTMYGVS